jgi:hypothetical protein
MEVCMNMSVKSSANVGHLLTGLGILTAVFLGVAGMVHSSYTRGQEKQDAMIEKVEMKAEKNKDCLGDVKVGIGVLQSDMNSVKENLDWIRRHLDADKNP